MAYDRYKSFRENGMVGFVPFLPIAKSTSDIYINYNKSKMRFDLLSYKYYGDANYGWLIMQANPELGSMEFKIKDGSVIRIPYPIESAIARYEESIANYQTTIR